MQMNPRPTRAEATDIANSVLDGTDGFVLGAQTSQGLHVSESVHTVLGICREAEAVFDGSAYYEQVSMHMQKVRSGCVRATEIVVKHILVTNATIFALSAIIFSE